MECDFHLVLADLYPETPENPQAEDESQDGRGNAMLVNLVTVVVTPMNPGPMMNAKNR